MKHKPSLPGCIRDQQSQLRRQKVAAVWQFARLHWVFCAECHSMSLQSALEPILNENWQIWIASPVQQLVDWNVCCTVRYWYICIYNMDMYIYIYIHTYVMRPQVFRWREFLSAPVANVCPRLRLALSESECKVSECTDQLICNIRLTVNLRRWTVLLLLHTVQNPARLSIYSLPRIESVKECYREDVLRTGICIVNTLFVNCSTPLPLMNLHP